MQTPATCLASVADGSSRPSGDPPPPAPSLLVVVTAISLASRGLHVSKIVCALGLLLPVVVLEAHRAVRAPGSVLLWTASCLGVPW